MEPSSDDIEALLKSLGLWPAGTDSDPAVLLARAQAATASAAAIGAWNRGTGFSPFLGDLAVTSSATYTLNAQEWRRSGLLLLGNGLLRLDEVTLNGSPIAPSAVWPQPSQNPAKGQPFTHLEFALCALLFNGYPLRPVEIIVTGAWGYCTALPGEVFGAILHQGALGTLLGMHLPLGVKTISHDGLREGFNTFGAINPAQLVAQWQLEFAAAVAQYKRLV